MIHALLLTSLASMESLLGAAAQAPPPIGPESAASEVLDRVYASAGLGVAFASAIKIQDSLVTSAAVGTSGIEFDAEPGVSGTLALGARVSDSLSAEVELGLSSIGFGGASGVMSIDLPGATPPSTGSLSGGSGDFLQTTVLVNGAYHLPLVKRTPGSNDLGLDLALGGGFGVVNTAADVSGINVASAGVPGLTMSLDGNGWSFAAQFKAGLEVHCTSSVSLGLTYKLMALSEADLGEAVFSPGLPLSASLETSSMIVQAVFATLEFRF